MRKVWTKEEIETLKEYSNKCHYTELVKVLPGRTIGAISYKIHVLKLDKVTENTKLEKDNSEIVKYIKDNWGKVSIREMALNLNVTVSVIYRYKKKYNLPNINQNKSKKWNKEVIESIKKDAETKTRKELAKKYKTTPSQISVLAHKNNIKLIDSKKIWNKEKEDELRELVNKGLNINEIANILKIKAATIRSKLRKMNLYDKVKKYPNRIKWNDEEIKLLKELITKKSTYEVAKILNKTEEQVYLKTKKLKLRSYDSNRSNWQDEEIDLLKRIYKDYDMDILTKVIGRSETSIRDKAKELDIELRYKDKKRWSIDEEELLKELANDYTIKEMRQFFDRTESSIRSKLHYMGINPIISSKYWTKEEENKLLELYNNHYTEDIATIMNKPYRAVVGKLYNLGLKINSKANNNWSKEEDNRLLELLKDYSSFEVAEMLNKSEECIIVRAIKLGYKTDKKNRNWTKEEDEQLKKLWGNISIDVIASRLDRTPLAIYTRANKLRLGSQISNNYDGLTIKEISNMFFISINAILTTWIQLGLKVNYRKRSQYSRYSYVTIENLYEFLEKNQNIWDSRILEKNILGKEPDWLIEKRKNDRKKAPYGFDIGSLNKQQLIRAKKYYLEEDEIQKVKRIEKRK